MKKNYIAPEFAIQSMETLQIIALSLQDTVATDDDALVKDAGDWDSFDDEVDE